MSKEEAYLKMLREGKEKGLNYFYVQYFRRFFYWGYRYTKQYAEAECIAQEAYVKLWQLRESIRDVEHLFSFMEKQVREGMRRYYRSKDNVFNAGLLRVDEYERPESVLPSTLPDSEQEEESIAEEYGEASPEMKALLQVLPFLGKEDELLIRLCLKFDFDPEKIAKHLGGVKPWQVSAKLNKCIRRLKSLLNAHREPVKAATQRKTLQPKENSVVLKMRYDERKSFEDIAGELGLTPQKVKLMFVQALKSKS